MRVRKEHERICEDLDIQLNMALNMIVGINLNRNFQLKLREASIVRVIVKIQNNLLKYEIIF